MTRGRTLDRISGCLIIFLIISFIISYLYQTWDRHSKVKQFSYHLNEYTTQPRNYFEMNNQLLRDQFFRRRGQLFRDDTRDDKREAYISGKVITIDKTENKIDRIYFDLPKDLRANTPEEVGTLIWLEYDEEYTCTYTDNTKGYRITCKVMIIDNSKKVIVSARSFTGSKPLRFKSTGVKGIGSKPTKEIVDYIKALPRR